MTIFIHSVYKCQLPRAEVRDHISEQWTPLNNKQDPSNLIFQFYIHIIITYTLLLDP